MADDLVSILCAFCIILYFVAKGLIREERFKRKLKKRFPNSWEFRWLGSREARGLYDHKDEYVKYSGKISKTGTIKGPIDRN